MGLQLAYRESSRARQPRADELADVASAALAGNRSAIHALMVALAPHLLRTVRSVLGRHDPDIEDVAQEAGLVVLRVLPTHRGEGTVCRFACRTAVLVAMNARRRRLAEKRGGRSARSDVDVEALAAAAGTPGTRTLAQCDPEAALSQSQAAAAARNLVLTLPPAQAEVLALHCMAGSTIPEIAEATGAPIETVRSRLRLARRALRLRLEAEPRWLEVLEPER